MHTKVQKRDEEEDKGKLDGWGKRKEKGGKMFPAQEFPWWHSGNESD